MSKLVEKSFQEKIKYFDEKYHVVNPIGKILFSHEIKAYCVNFIIERGR